MTLIITGDDVKRLLTIKECVEAMRLTFQDFSNGIAVNRPRVRYLAQGTDPKKRYWANVHVGAAPSAGVACVRAGSQIKVINEAGQVQKTRNENPRPFNWGLVILYSLDTAEPLALMHEFELSGMRVGATNAAVVDHIARPDAATLGLFGSGKQSRAALDAICAVRGIRRVNIYSPDPVHRDRFSRDMARDGLEIVPVSSPRDAVIGADIVCCATASASPVFEGDWLEHGQLVISIANSDVNHTRHEVDRRTLERARAVIINDWESVFENKQIELLEPIESGALLREHVYELGDLFTGKADVRQPPRGAEDEGIIYYKNNSGLAIQFAAAGGMIYRRALEQGGCKEIPTEWLGSDLSEYIAAGFRPSP